MYDGIRKISVEIQATEKWRNDGKCVTRKATAEESEKYKINPGGEDMPRPKGSKNKPKVNNEQKITLKQTQKEVDVIRNQQKGEPEPSKTKEQLLDPPEVIPEHISEFRETIRMKHHAACKFALEYKIKKELEQQNDGAIKETILRIMDYCKEVLMQIEKDL